jgi:PAS domain S-box-containing protein
MLLNARQIYRADINSKIILLAIEDITERRLIEEKLTLAAIVESSKDAIVGKSIDGTITSWNKGAEEIYGYTKSEIIGKSISVLVPPELSGERSEILSKIKLGEWITNYETVRQRKDGQNIYVSLTVSAVYDAEGRIIGASTIARDITERKQLEKLLLDSEEQYRLLFETANDGIVLLEKSEGKIAHINPSVEKMLGYSAKEVIGNKLHNVGLIIDNGDFQITMKKLNKEGILRYNDVPVKTKSGKHIYADTYLVDKAKFAQCNIRDITERKRSEESLRESEQRLKEAQKVAHIGHWELDPKIGTPIWSDEIFRIFGLDPKDNEPSFVNHETHLHPDDWPILDKAVAKASMDGAPFDIQFRIVQPSGEIKWMHSLGTTIMDSKGVILKLFGTAQDITERKRAEEELRKSEENFRLSLDDSPLGVRIVTVEGETLYANQATLKIYGYDRIEELKRTPLKERYTPESYAEFKTRKEKRERGEVDPSEYEISIMRKNGEVRHIHVFRKEIWWNGARQFQVIYIDITERRKTEEELLIIKKAVESSSDAIGISDPQGHHFYQNKAFSKLFEYTQEELDAAGGGPVAFADKEVAREMFDAIMGGLSWSSEVEMVSKSGRKFPVLERADAIKDENGKIIGLIGLHTDITDRKRAEEALRESEDRYRSLYVDSRDSIMVLSPDRGFIAANPATIKLFACRDEQDFMNYSPTSLSPEYQPDGVRSIDKSYEMMCLALEKGSHFFEWMHRRADGTDFPVTVLLSRFESSATPLLQATVRDITERKLVEAELQRTLDSLSKAFNTIVQVLISAIEARDPYTSGHQFRSSNLACAIATEMGLPQDKIDGLLMAGSIHDIGKISIPAEILSKPTKLTDIEFSLIKEHSHSGYEMLKDVESPWPLAQIVYQHHERMDGSGYPRNLKGDEIIMEARIMAVADVVEAMASHRPYRPGLGIDAALAEIEKNKGTFYDNAVADACLRLFREKGYQLT